jgi:hypothetical protein
MAVLVTSQVSQSGSTIFSGNVPEIVGIKVDPGYKDSPGHAGTGTVVGVICHM